MDVDLQNSRIEFPFQYSVKNLRKSIHHQLDYGGTYQDYVKAMSCFDQLIENAIPIEVHKDKKEGTSKENKDLERVYVLASAYTDGDSIVPVEFEVKEFKERDNSLYMTVVLTKIDPEVVDTGVPGKPGNVPHLVSRSTVSLQCMFENVNPKDGRFLEYVPDGFLNAEQKRAKYEALALQEEEYKWYDSKTEVTEDQETAVTDLDLTVDAKTESVAPSVLFSERTWTASDYVQDREKRTYVLVSAYMDGNSIVSVEFEVKVFWSSDPKLYLVVALTKIDSEVLEKAPESIDADTPSLFPESTYSLQSIFRNVNPNLDFWVEMAHDFIDDHDAVDMKVGKYWRDIVKR